MRSKHCLMTSAALLLLAVSVQVLGAEVPAAVSEGQGPIWFWQQLGLAFFWGLAMCLTPCVYPMVFITVAIVAGRAGKGRLSGLIGSVVYVLGLSVVYGLLGLLVAALGGEVRFFLDTAWVRVPVAAIFVILALSMFDVVTIGFGEGSVDKVRTALVGKGGIVGVFVLGAVSALAASPCLTGPLALLLYRVAETGNRWFGFWSLFAMAWGMGTVLIIAGTSAGLLPKPGEWMNWVKQLLGFILFWAAAYFLKPVVGIAVYTVASGVIVVAGVVFLGGIDRLTAESGARERLRAAAGLCGIILGAVLMLRGFGVLGSGARPAAGPEGLETVWTEAAEAEVDSALSSGRPVVIDFYGDACPTCDKLYRETLLEEHVLSQLQVFKTLRVNASREESLRERFSLVGVPTVVLFDAGGSEVERFSGFRNPSEFLEFLAKLEGSRAGEYPVPPWLEQSPGGG